MSKCACVYTTVCVDEGGLKWGLKGCFETLSAMEQLHISLPVAGWLGGGEQETRYLTGWGGEAFFKGESCVVSGRY